MQSDNPLNLFATSMKTATRIANAEEQAFFRDEYAKEIADHNNTFLLTTQPCKTVTLFSTVKTSMTQVC